MTKSIFISYRKSDSLTLAFWLHAELSRALVDTKVFIDEKGLEAGDKWVDYLESNVKLASVLIAVIGPNWLGAQDEDYRRRLDDSHDWVRKEIECAIANNLLIIPLLVSDAELPRKKALPTSLVPLINHQSFKLRTQYLPDDVNLLLKTLEQKGFERAVSTENSSIGFPAPGRQPAIPLSEQELDQIPAILPQWTKENGRLEAGVSIELRRNYEFETFESAMHFMLVASRRFSRVNHHPTWQNRYHIVIVWLTTWDNGFKPSIYDIDLAKYLDILYLDYEPREVRTSLSVDPVLLSQIDLLVEQGMYPNRNTALQASVQESLKRQNQIK
ncbi:MAG: TIR domain-containing protein [Lyngbya sp. HA4199-MV5]|jgi:pterin-4a-carbinolamine dehydratase|nr:TIR domain-containing protein [Lyngbya sp. HA4199-MV5]